MVDQVVADRVVLPRLDRQLELRPHAVRARDEHRLGHVRRHAEHAAEAAELTARSGGERRHDVRLDALLRVVRRVDVDAGRAIVQRVRSLDVLLEAGEPIEVGDARSDLRRRDLDQAIHRETLDGERSHRRTVDDGATQVRFGDVAAARQIAHESTGERIARARRIEHRLERIRRREEDARLVNMNAPCSPFLMTTSFGPRAMIQRAAFTRLNSSVSCRASASFSVIRSTRFSSSSRSGRRLSIQKFIVSHATSFGLLDLRQHLELQPRIDVAEEDERRDAKLLGNLRPEVREHTEVRLERLGGVEIVPVASAPAERRRPRRARAPRGRPVST